MPLAPSPRKRRAPPDTVRMEDVARAAGVSAITVSRALNAPDKLSPATLRAVRTAIERLRYVPNLTAGSLASSRSRTVAVIVPTVNSSIFSDTIGGVAQALAAHRYQLLLGQTNYRLEDESALVQAFLGRRVDGLVLTGVNHARGVRSSILRAGIPVVETWDLSARPIDMLVGFSNHGAGVAAGALFECTRRRIVVPRDLAIMGFADLPIAASIEPRLTSMQVRAGEMGLRAGRMLMAHLQGEAARERIVDLGFAVVERDSA